MRTLLSVDDIVRGLHDYLSAAGRSDPSEWGGALGSEWDRTYFIHTSDHGYNLGQFRVDSHKTMVYDHCSRVPFSIRGPRITPGVVLPLVTSNG